jgi:hypothetical protein
MAPAKQRPISISSDDRAVLDSQKRLFEQSTGERTDWGRFLGTAVLLGLAAVGIYHLVRATNRSPQSVDVQCYQCSGNFILAVPRGTGRAIQTTCPHCNAELVVDIGTPR